MIHVPKTKRISLCLKSYYFSKETPIFFDYLLRKSFLHLWAFIIIIILCGNYFSFCLLHLHVCFSFWRSRLSTLPIILFLFDFIYLILKFLTFPGIFRQLPGVVSFSMSITHVPITKRIRLQFKFNNPLVKKTIILFAPLFKKVTFLFVNFTEKLAQPPFGIGYLWK